MGIFTGCSKTNTTEEVSVPNAASETETESGENETSDMKFAELLPKTEDYFKTADIIIITPDDGTSYSFRIENYQDGEYEAYVEACKNMGFDDVSYEGENDGGKMFFAYSSDGKYYLQITFGYQIEAIDIVCKISTEK